MKGFAFMRGLILGALAGTAVGILLAPEPGSALQTRLRERFNEVMDEGRRAAAERRAELEAQLAEAKRAPRGA
jgi:gas vesicle protein